MNRAGAMLLRFLNFWILARVMQAGVAAGLCVLGLIVGWRLARRWQLGGSSESQLARERHAELVATAVQAALVLEILGLAMALALADHLVGSIRGAMCAFGVFASTDVGFYGLLSSALAAVACSLWVILHRFDLRLETAVLTRRKFLWLAVVAPLSVLDFAMVLAFVAELDFSVIASCCSVWVDDNITSQKSSLLLMSPIAAGVTGLLATLAALAAGLLAFRRPCRATALGAAVVSALAPFGALPGILWVVAPHALGTPQHPCPFCLLHAQGGWIGWPLFTALFVAGVTGVGIGFVELNRRAVAEREQLAGMQRTLARWSCLAWSGVLACGIWPVARYWLQSGGVSVFGAI